MISRYPKYKKSGVDWIEDIPENWTVSQYKFEADVQNGFAFKSSLFDKNEGFPILRIRDITKGYTSTYYKGEFEEDYIVRKDDLLIGMDGDYNIRWWENGEALLNQRCCRIIEKENVSRRFLYYTLPFNLKIINDLTYFTTVKHLSSGDIYNAKFPLPSFKEQIKIAAYLDHQTGLIDDIIEKKQQLIEKLKEQRQAIINEAVTKGLNPDAPMKNSGVEWIGEIPTDWTVSQYKFEAYVQNGFAFKSSLFDKNEGFPILRIRDITKGYTSTYYKGEYEDDYIVRKDDLLIGMDGDYNIRWWENGDVLLNQRCCRIIENENVSRRFLYYTLPFNLQIINDLTYYTTVKHLSSGDIYNARFPLPSFEEQTKIAEHLDHQTKLIDTIITKKQNQIDKLRHFCQSIISEAVTGKIDVREWEPKVKETA